MVRARKAVVYLAGDAEAAKKAEQVVRGFTDVCHYFGAFGAASKVKLINNLLVAVHIAATAEAMALGLKAGVDVDLMIKAVAAGSGGSTQFGIRAPGWRKRHVPAGAGHHHRARALFRADRRLRRPRRRGDAAARPRGRAAISAASTMGLGEYDNAIMVDVIGGMNRAEEARRPAMPHAKNSRVKREKHMIRVRKIAHASYEMPDLDKQTEYYTDILGLR